MQCRDEGEGERNARPVQITYIVLMDDTHGPAYMYETSTYCNRAIRIPSPEAREFLLGTVRLRRWLISGLGMEGWMDGWKRFDGMGIPLPEC
jgi:hypothetical protein